MQFFFRTIIIFKGMLLHGAIMVGFLRVTVLLKRALNPPTTTAFGTGKKMSGGAVVLGGRRRLTEGLYERGGG